MAIPKVRYCLICEKIDWDEKTKKLSAINILDGFMEDQPIPDILISLVNLDNTKKYLATVTINRQGESMAEYMFDGVKANDLWDVSNLLIHNLSLSLAGDAPVYIDVMLDEDRIASFGFPMVKKDE